MEMTSHDVSQVIKLMLNVWFAILDLIAAFLRKLSLKFLNFQHYVCSYTTYAQTSHQLNIERDSSFKTAAIKIHTILHTI